MPDNKPQVIQVIRDYQVQSAGQWSSGVADLVQASLMCHTHLRHTLNGGTLGGSLLRRERVTVWVVVDQAFASFEQMRILNYKRPIDNFVSLHSYVEQALLYDRVELSYPQFILKPLGKNFYLPIPQRLDVLIDEHEQFKRKLRILNQQIQ